MTAEVRKSKLGLLFKEYYNEASSLVEQAPVDMARMAKLPTRVLMSKSVESLRSFKEAEAELRLLLYNNCDKLLEAVHVVVSIRAGSDALLEQSQQAGASCGKRPLTASAPTRYQAALGECDRLSRLELLLGFPKKLLNSSTIPAATLISEYLLIRDKFFYPLSGKYPLVAEAAKESAEIVDSQLVPILIESLSPNSFSLLLQLYPESHGQHQRIVAQFIDLQLAQLLKQVEQARFVKTPNVGLFKSILATWFADNASGGTAAGPVILDELLPEASWQIVTSLARLADGDPAAIIEEAAAAHLRIPAISSAYLSQFRHASWLSWARGVFERSVDREAVDALHTQACSALVRVTTQCEDLSSADLVGLLREYYVLATRPLCGDEAACIAGLQWNRAIETRGTIARSLASLWALLDEEPSDHDFTEDVLAESDRAYVQLLACWVGTDGARLQQIVSQIAGEGLLRKSEETVRAFSGRRSSTADLELAETVHARKLIFPKAISGEVGILIIICHYCRACKVDSVEPIVAKALAETHLPPTYLATVLAMLNDQPN